MIIGIDASRAFAQDRTGTENYSYHLISHILQLPDARAHHFVLFTRANAHIPDWARVSHAEVVTIPQKYLWTQVGLAGATWGKYAYGNKLKTKSDLDVLWIPAHTLPALRKPGIRTVVTIHGLEYKWLPEYNNLLQRWYLPLSTYYAARHATQLIAVSEFTKKQLLLETHISPDKVKVIYEGVGIRPQDTSESQMVKKLEGQKILTTWGITPQKYILFVGTLQPRKNLPALIAAYVQAYDTIPDIKLVIAGGKGWQTVDIFRAARQSGRADAIIFTGRVDDRELETLYREAMVVVQPSIQEGFGLPILEAMQYDVPIISSDGGAIPEVVGDVGLIVPLGNTFVSDVSHALVRVATEPRLRSQLVGRGRERIRQLTWTAAARETLDVLASPNNI